MSSIDPLRIRVAADRPARPDAGFVLYWMRAARRTRFNPTLQHALDWAAELQRPLLVVETLGGDGTPPTARHHRFVLDGMADNAAAFEGSPVLYHPHVQQEDGAIERLLIELAENASLLVTDEFPTAGRIAALEGVLAAVEGRVETVDGNGLVPLRAVDRFHATAYSLRRWLQHHLPEQLRRAPRADPLRAARLPALKRLPSGIAKGWPRASAALLEGNPSALGRLPLDHGVAVAEGEQGGAMAARRRLRRFAEKGLPAYVDERNQPERESTSGLSAHLHHGHIASHEILGAIAAREGVDPADLPPGGRGARAGWWRMSPEAEAFLDQLVTWRELSYNGAHHLEDYDRYESLPEWARTTLEEHLPDPRAHVYDLQALAEGRTHDPLWNAAQGQLVSEGRMHNMLRMLWGKKVLEWTRDPREAMERLVHLNDRYALDGSDPNSYAGIGWVLGRYDRPWGPERPIFGKIRYMSSENTARKVRVRGFIERYGRQARLF